MLAAFAERAAALGIAHAEVEGTWPEIAPDVEAVHPMAWLSPYWAALHGLRQPTTPTAADAKAVLVALGFDVREQRSEREVQMIGELGDEQVKSIARRLCLRTDRVPELRQLLDATPPPAERDVVTLWFDL